jgi:hypothetical protein
MVESLLEKLFSEEFVSSMVGWGELVRSKDGDYYLDRQQAPDFLNFEKWYSCFPPSLISVAKIVSVRALDNVNKVVSDLCYNNDTVKDHMVKEIVFEISTMKHSGELQAYLQYYN